MRPLHRFTVLPTVPDALTPLRVLAHNLRWSWHPATQELFRAIDPAGWEASGHNPLRMLNETDAHVLEQAAADPDFLARHRTLLEDQSTFSSVTVEELLDAGALPETTVAALRDRYLPT